MTFLSSQTQAKLIRAVLTLPLDSPCIQSWTSTSPYDTVNFPGFSQLQLCVVNGWFTLFSAIVDIDPLGLTRGKVTTSLVGCK